MAKIMKILCVAMLIVGTAGIAGAQDKHPGRNADGLEIDVWANKGEGSTYYYGEDLAIYFRANNDCYVVIYDIDPEGNVSMLFPDNYESSCQVTGGEIYRIPDMYDDYHLEIQGPSGQEYIYAVATYNRITPPDFIRYEYFEYGDWDYYYDDFIHAVSGERAKFARELNERIAQGDYISTHTMFNIDQAYRHHKWYRHWTYDPYYIGSVWVGSDYPGCEVWIDGIYWGIAPILVPEIYVGRHWIWIYYHGYPCWQDYVYIVRGQRYYVDVKIKKRYLDYEYGRANLRDWRFKYERHANESDFIPKAKKDRIKHTRPKHSAPEKVIEKYSRINASSTKFKDDRSSKEYTADNNSRIKSESNASTGDSKSRSKSETRYKSNSDNKSNIKAYKPKTEERKSTSIKRKSNTSSSSGSEKKSLNSNSGSPIIQDKSVKSSKSNSGSNSSKSQSQSSSSNVSKQKTSTPISKPAAKSPSVSKQSSSKSSSKSEDKGKRSKR